MTMTDRPFSSNALHLPQDAIGPRMSQPDDAMPLDRAVARAGGNDHPVIAIPFTAYIDGRQFAGKGLSLVEAHLTGLADQTLEGGIRLVRLAFEFEGFSVSLTPLMRIDRVSLGQLSLHFTEPTGPHLPQLRYILNDYIAGDLASIGAVIRAGGLQGADAGAVPRPPRTQGQRIRSGVGTVFVLSAAAILLATSWFLIEKRLLVTEFAPLGQLTAEGQTLRAVADGQIVFIDPEAAKGDVVIAIAATSGETLSLAMPCDCDVLALGIREGSTVLSGEDLLRLTEAAAPTVIEIDLPARDTIGLSAQGAAEFRLAGGGWRDAVLLDIGPAAQGDSGTVPVRLAPSAALDPGSIGSLVEMRLVRDAASLLAPFTDRAADLIRSVMP